MTTIFLSGGGNEIQSVELDKAFYDSLMNKKILYIPLARSNDKYLSCKEWFTKIFAGFGQVTIRMVTTFEELTDLDFEIFDGIYMGGGNTYRLIHGLRQYGIVEKIRRYTGRIYGGSAGAIVLGKVIKTAELTDENPGLPDVAGLSKLQDLSIACHVKESMINQLVALHIPILALSESAGVIWDEKFLHLTGTGPVWIIRDEISERIFLKTKIGSL
ncbi:MAG: Type 1 glutamine amidotransferase-like domain-containing protein [Nanoarchaeota archaeon]